MIKLTITEKGGEPRLLSFDKDEVLIGRVSGNDIVLPKGNVSKRHSRLALRNGQVEISDLKSTNGTYVNGRKIVDALVLSGTDRVYVGDFLITIEGLPAAESASGARKMPVPPPPPPPRGGSSASRLPASEDTSTGGEDEEEAPLAARPPRSSSRLPVPPPPPPPKRPPTPMNNRAIDEALADDMAPPAPGEMDAEENTGSAGLFEKRPSAPAAVSGDDHAAFDGAGGKANATGRRPGAVLPSEAFAPAGEPSVPTLAPTGEPGAAELDALLVDPSVLQIVITGPDAAYVDRGGTLSALGSSLGDPNVVADAVWRIANAAVPPPPPENPVVDVRLPDGTRLAAVFPPAAPRGVVATIRKPGLAERALADLCPAGAKELETLLDAAMATQRNLLLTGDTAALAALASALGGAIPAERRVVSVGAAPARARPGWTDLVPTPDLSLLIRVAASLRAEHFLFADGAGPELADLLLAAARGQEGLAIAVAARTPGEALARLDALAAPALGMAAGGAGSLIASTIDLVVLAATGPDGAVRVVEIAEPRLDGRQLGAGPVAAWRSDGGRRGGATGKLEVQGVSARLGATFAAAGRELPGSLVQK